MHFFHRPPDANGRSKAYLVTVHILGGLALAATLALVFGYFVMLLWNLVVPDVFGLMPLGYWQAVGLLALARMLTGGFGHPHGGHGRFRRPGNEDQEGRSRAWDNACGRFAGHGDAAPPDNI